MRVTITFHGPFRVATGNGRPGIDAVVDRDNLLPASTLKGLMRDSAERLLPGLPRLVEAVFGGPHHPTPWGWEAARFQDGDPEGQPVVAVRARVRLDEDAGAALRDHLLYGEEVWAHSAEFTVSQHGPLPETGGPLLDRDGHLAVLACAAAGVHSLGAERRRGLGWVQCAPADPVVDETLLSRFTALADQWRSHPRA
ncbi:RAMP superfamily CRISPR-associated protein [Streptomyces yerevanensis]|uniref:RAMP superfamily CRISPR-associated protein n=1 Tax=Streptomyces yerevanensis TaxID=66378 RepID=UPI00068CBE61|nr:RAMP superfamily CRISPR-associated protein [Streptomyces yerevanensis]